MHTQEEPPTPAPSTPMVALRMAAMEKLDYDVVGWSSHSAHYHPRNIKEDKPQDQSSRWSSGSNNQLQFVTLRLERESVVHTISFGKYQKGHVCNMKEFKVYGGLTENNMVELLHSGLRNDEEPETFPLRRQAHGVPVPCKYIKIVPLLAFGANFNFSVWYVRLMGFSHGPLVDSALARYHTYLELESVRLILKHLRQRSHLDIFDMLQQRTGVALEHPTLTHMHNMLVVEGNFQGCEEMFRQACGEGLFAEYIADRPYSARWTRLCPVDQDGNENGPKPGRRGGHQMCIDIDGGIIFLFGGWDGKKDCGDFWAYNMKDNRWTCLSNDTSMQAGPGPRSCHKMCLDPVRRCIYTMGRYVEPDQRLTTNMTADFHRYDIDTGTWTLISRDTGLEGGPSLIFDHQMVHDAATNSLLVFGGREVRQSGDNKYSGLYHYDCANNTWSLLRSDDRQDGYCVQLKGRIGHSMLLDPHTRSLVIFAGQRLKDYLSDFYVYDLQTGHVVDLCRETNKIGGPDANFTQRATIDPERRELYLLSGLVRDKNKQSETLRSSFWVYHIDNMQWRKVYEYEHAEGSPSRPDEPCPRFAHQLVFDTTSKVHYLFGGNPGDSTDPELRLDDFWALHLQKADPSEVVQRATYLIRRQRFKEMCETDPIGALAYLQTELAAVVDHTDAEQSAEFRALTMAIFRAQQQAGHSGPGTSMDTGDTAAAHYVDRTQLYEELLKFFPAAMKQPPPNMADLLVARL